MLDATLHGQRLSLLAERAAFWHGPKWLLVADLHVGKPAAYRAGGVAVPEPALAGDLGRLTGLIRLWRPARLVILGDLLHAAAGRTRETLHAFGAWRREHGATPITLVRGNHDLAAGDPPESWGVECVGSPWPHAGVDLAHEPTSGGTGLSIAGHLHPGVRLGQPGAARAKTAGGRLRAPCFWLHGRCLVLPAFGSFTGLSIASPREGDRIFAVGAGEVIEVPVVHPVA